MSGPWLPRLEYRRRQRHEVEALAQQQRTPEGVDVLHGEPGHDQLEQAEDHAHAGALVGIGPGGFEHLLGVVQHRRLAGDLLEQHHGQTDVQRFKVPLRKSSAMPPLGVPAPADATIARTSWSNGGRPQPSARGRAGSALQTSSSDPPFCASHRGESGRAVIPTASAAATSDDEESSVRHPPSSPTMT